jgi:hypothetical protein
MHRLSTICSIILVPATETLLILLFVAGCGEATDATATEPKAAKPHEPPSTAEITARPPERAQPPAPPGKIVADPLRHELPDAKTDYEPGQPVWAVQPAAEPGRFMYGRARFDEIRGRSRIAVTGEKQHELPAAFVHPALPAKDLRPGQPVLAQADGQARLGRVQAISGETIRVKYGVDSGKAEEVSVGPDQIEILERSSLAPGAPVLFSRGDTWFIGTVALTTGKQAYVICGGLLELARTAVTPLDLTKIIKPDTPALAVADGAKTCHAAAATVVGTSEAGVLYEVQIGGARSALPLGRVSTHPSEPRPVAP